MCVCVCVYVRVCMCECVYVCVREREREILCRLEDGLKSCPNWQWQLEVNSVTRLSGC